MGESRKWGAAVAAITFALAAGAILIVGDEPRNLTERAAVWVAYVSFWGAVVALVALAGQAAWDNGWVPTGWSLVRLAGVALILLGVTVLWLGTREFRSRPRVVPEDAAGIARPESQEQLPDSRASEIALFEAAVNYGNWAWPRDSPSLITIPTLRPNDFVLLWNEVTLVNYSNEVLEFELLVSLPEVDGSLAVRNADVSPLAAPWLTGFTERFSLSEDQRLGPVVVLEPRTRVTGWAWIWLGETLVKGTVYGRALDRPDPAVTGDQGLLELTPRAPTDVRAWVHGTRLVVAVKRAEDGEPVRAPVHLTPREWAQQRWWGR